MHTTSTTFNLLRKKYHCHTGAFVLCMEPKCAKPGDSIVSRPLPLFWAPGNAGCGVCQATFVLFACF